MNTPVNTTLQTLLYVERLYSEKYSLQGVCNLQFLCFVHRIMVIYSCIKFQENISNSFQVTERTPIYYRSHYFQSSKGHKSKSRLTRVMVFMFCTSFYDALHMCKVSLKYLKQFSIY